MSPTHRDPAHTSTISTLNDLVFHIREISSARPDFLTTSRNGRREALTATDFLRSVHSLAVALEDRGLRAGERVGIFSENRPEWHVVDFACHLLGSPTVPIFPALSRDQVAYVLRNSGARWIFFSNVEKRELLLGLKGALTQIPKMIAFDGEAATTDGATITRLMGEGVSQVGEVPLERFRGRAQEEDLASIHYTSGTTGDPKGVMLSHGNFISNMLSCSRLFDLGAEDRAVSLLPLSHVLQRTVDHLCFFRGAKIHYTAHGEEVTRSLAVERPTILAAHPEFFERIRASEIKRIERSPLWHRRLFDWALDAGKRHAVAGREGFIGPILALQCWIARAWPLRSARDHFGGHLRFAISGGSPLLGEVAEFFESAGIPLYQGYGLTETSPVLAANSPSNQRIGSVGKPLSEVELRIDREGEILVRGPGVMQGYWQNPDATAASINESGWFRTGDLGRMDKSGYVFVTDRKQDVLTLANGEPVSPRPIEAALVGGPIAQAVVVGDGRPYAAALLVPEPGQLDATGSPVDLDRLTQSIEQRLERVNMELPEQIRIRKWRLLNHTLTVEDGHLTPTQELRRRQIHQTFAKEIVSLYKASKSEP